MPHSDIEIAENRDKEIYSNKQSEREKHKMFFEKPVGQQFANASIPLFLNAPKNAENSQKREEMESERRFEEIDKREIVPPSAGLDFAEKKYGVAELASLRRH